MKKDEWVENTAPETGVCRKEARLICFFCSLADTHLPHVSSYIITFSKHWGPVISLFSDDWSFIQSLTIFTQTTAGITRLKLNRSDQTRLGHCRQDWDSVDQTIPVNTVKQTRTLKARLGH